jgi:hypothetical protein
MKTIKILTPQVTPVGMLDDWNYVYVIKRMSGFYKIKGYDKLSGRFIFKKLNLKEKKQMIARKKKRR